MQEQTAEENRHPYQDRQTVSGPVELKPISNDPITHPHGRGCKSHLPGHRQSSPASTSSLTPTTPPNASLSISPASASPMPCASSAPSPAPSTSLSLPIPSSSRRTPAHKHTDLDQEAVQTFYLSNVAQQNDANEIVIAIRNLVDPSVQDRPHPQSERDRHARHSGRAAPRSEAAQRPRPRPPGGRRRRRRPRGQSRQDPQPRHHPAAVHHTYSAGQPKQHNQQQSTTTTDRHNHHPLQLHPQHPRPPQCHQLRRDCQPVAPSTRCSPTADTRILQNPRIRATDGQRATLKIGSKIPIAPAPTAPASRPEP